MGKKNVTIVIPTINRALSLALVLNSLSYQNYRDFDIVISDQSDQYDIANVLPIQTLVLILEQKGMHVTILKNMPKRGIAHQRQFLLDHTKSNYCLFLDDDVILDSWVVQNMVEALDQERCGFVGQAVIGLSFLSDYRPEEELIEFWEGKVFPEKIQPEGTGWERYKLHNAANLYHVQKRLKISERKPKKYKIAWTGGCVLFDRQKLEDCGGFQFWKNIPESSCGEDVYVQQKVMEKYGGFGLIPSGAYHLELPTTIKDRSVNVPELLLKQH